MKTITYPFIHTCLKLLYSINGMQASLVLLHIYPVKEFMLLHPVFSGELNKLHPGYMPNMAFRKVN